jgi:peptide/nickel transport system substrate-binding protein
MDNGRKRGRTPLRFGVLGILLVGCLLLATIVGALALGGDDEPARNPGDAIVYGLTLNPSGFDPHIHQSSELGIPFFSVYDTLVYRHPQTLEFVPGLAERWEMAPDGLSWTFFLKQNVRFHDGTEFNAAAVAANLDRIMNPDVGSQKARVLLDAYTGYEIVDPYTITLRVSQPYAPLLDALSQVYLGIASPAALKANTNNSYQWHQVGTGPYKLDEFVPGRLIRLIRNEDYNWGPVFYAPVVDDSLDTIEFRFYTDPATRSLALESGEVDVVGELLPTDAELLAGNVEVDVHQVPVPGTPQQFFFNTRHAPLDSMTVRQALLYGTNRTEIVDAVYQGRSPIAHGPLTSTVMYYDPAVEQMYPFDLDQARALLASQGLADTDNDGILEWEGEPLELTVVFGPWNQMPDVAQLIQSQWRELGIDVELIQVPDFPSLRQRVRDDDYDVISFYDFGVDPSILNRFYLSGAVNNWSGFSDPQLDQTLYEAMRQTNSDARRTLYSAAQIRIMEQALVLPIREYVNLVGVSSDLDGVVFSAQGWWPLLRNFQLTR